MANNTGGVLTSSTQSFLFNSAITAADLGGYRDSVTGDPVLIFKKLGYSIYSINRNAKVYLTCNDPGAWKALLVTMNPHCPCDECNYEYGFKIVSKVQMPGHKNSISNFLTNTYFSKMESVECDQGYIEQSLILKMEDNLINQINSYEPFNQDGLMPAQYATRYYVIEDTDTSDASTLTVTIDGIDYVISSTVPNETLVEAINNNAGIAGRVKAIYLTNPSGSTYQFAVFGEILGVGDMFTVTAGTDTNIEQRSIMILSRDKRFNISVEINNSVGFVDGINIAKIYMNDGSAMDEYCITFRDSIGGDSRALNSVCCSDNAFTPNTVQYENVNTWHLTTNGYDIYAYSEDDDAYISYEPGNYTVQLGTKYGMWEILSNDKVFEVFSHSPNFGGLSQQVRKKYPLEDTRYCKIDIVWELPIADLVGSNHMNSRRGSVSMYFPMMHACDVNFNSANPMGTGGGGNNDMNVIEFIEAVLAGNIL